MKNNLIVIFYIIFFFQSAFADNLNVQSSSISIDKNTKITIFKDDVVVSDSKNNILKTKYAEYDKILEILESKGETTILTSEGYFLSGNNIKFNNQMNLIISNENAEITDIDGNKITVENFEYSTDKSFFKSIGNIKVIDIHKNSYNFTQVYIDEKKREIIGTDIKAYLNQEDFKIQARNKPRVFANAVKLDSKESQFTKSIFSICDYREDDKCPPWSLQANKMRHDKIKKTIFYDNAIIKVYDLPIFYFPKFSHPDPSVDRRSGFLAPSFADTKNLGSSFELPYFWNINKDKDFTITPKLFASEHPLLLGEYRQAFFNSNLILDLGYTEGYKNTTNTKKAGNKSHFFAKFVKNFTSQNNAESNLELTLQDVSNDKYLKLYKIDTNLVEYQKDIIENSLDFTHENEEFFLGMTASSFETLKENYNDKYEYVLPDLYFDRNLFNNSKYGSADFNSNIKVHNYDTNKFSKFFVNNIKWKSLNTNYLNKFDGHFLAQVKNVNYEAKNISLYKKDTTSEVFGALGYLSEIQLYKKNKNDNSQFLTPKMLFRIAPNHMRKDENYTRLNHLNIFSLDRLDSNENFEGGVSTTLGFDYEIKNSKKKLDFSIGQIINHKENKNMPTSSGLDEKLSDVVGFSKLKINNKIDIDYNFAIDQNYKEFNYNEINSNLNFDPLKFSFGYLQEEKHIGDQEYAKFKIDLEKGENGIFSAETKRNLVTNSSEFYNLSYEYLNDCLKAGIVYRREFYNDSEIESENSLMFKVTLIPFGNVNTPAVNR